MRTEYDLYHWPVGRSTADPARRLATVHWAMTVAGHEDPTDWTPRQTLGCFYLPLTWTSATERWAITAVQVPEHDAERIELALEAALSYGQTDGAHHKMWVIDQMVRLLTGDRYEQVITEYCAGEDGPETYAWDEGIAP